MPRFGWDYLESCNDGMVSVQTTRGTTQKLVVKIPTIEGLATALNIGLTTVYKWEKLYPAFAVMLKRLRQIQADRLIQEGLSGRYNPLVAKIMLSKHGYRDGSDIDMTSKGEKIEGFTYVAPKKEEEKK